MGCSQDSTSAGMRDEARDGKRAAKEAASEATADMKRANEQVAREGRDEAADAQRAKEEAANEAGEETNLSRYTYDKRDKLTSLWRQELSRIKKGLPGLDDKIAKELNEEFVDAEKALDKLAKATRENWQDLRQEAGEQIQEAKKDLNQARYEAANR